MARGHGDVVPDVAGPGHTSGQTARGDSDGHIQRWTYTHVAEGVKAEMMLVDWSCWSTFAHWPESECTWIVLCPIALQ